MAATGIHIVSQTVLCHLPSHPQHTPKASLTGLMQPGQCSSSRRWVWTYNSILECTLSYTLPVTSKWETCNGMCTVAGLPRKQNIKGVSQDSTTHLIVCSFITEYSWLNIWRNVFTKNRKQKGVIFKLVVVSVNLRSLSGDTKNCLKYLLKNCFKCLTTISLIVTECCSGLVSCN